MFSEGADLAIELLSFFLFLFQPLTFEEIQQAIRDANAQAEHDKKGMQVLQIGDWTEVTGLVGRLCLLKILVWLLDY